MQPSSTGPSEERLKRDTSVVSYSVREESVSAQDASLYVGEALVRESTQADFVLAAKDTSTHGNPSPPGRKASWVSHVPPTWELVAHWRQDVQRRRVLLLDELNRFELTSEAHTAERDYLATDLLEDANKATQERQRLLKWWWGTEIERAWARLREVEERTVDLLPDAELMAYVADTLQHARYYIKGDDQRVLHLEMLRREAVKTNPPTLPADLRPAIVNVLRGAHARADRANQEARYLRNRLLIGSVVIALAAAILVFAQSRVPDVQFLATASPSASGSIESSAAAAGSPTTTASSPTTAANPPAPSASSPTPTASSSAPAANAPNSAPNITAAPVRATDSPEPWVRSNTAFLVLVMLFGSVGALFTAIPAMSRVPSDFSPFNLPLQQFLLKIAFGSLTAVVGLAALQNTEKLAPFLPTTLPGVFLIAMLFGAGQQVVTQYVDKRAAEILKATAPASPKGPAS